MVMRRPLLRAAAVGGGAYMGANRVTYKKALPRASPATAARDDNVEQLQKLADMREQGILADDEFAVAKQNILTHT